MNWWLPQQASTFAGDIDRMFTLILVITGLAFVIVEAGLLWFVIKYRGRPGRKAYYTHGNVRAEYLWTAVPAVVVVALALMSNNVWVKIKGRNSIPADAYPVAVTAKQFEWIMRYPGADGRFGRVSPGLVDKEANPVGLDREDPAALDDIVVRNALHLPVGRPIVLHLAAEDVIHSFFVPQFRVKQDIVPGMSGQTVWFEATRPGEYEIGCAELCGMGHYKMRGRVFVHTQEDFDAWVQQQAAGGETPS